jgi:hypothetical protein
MTNLGVLAIIGLGAAGLYLYSERKKEEAAAAAMPQEPSTAGCVANYPADTVAQNRYEWLTEHPYCIEHLPPEALQQLAEDLYAAGMGEVGALVETWLEQLSEQVQP